MQPTGSPRRCRADPGGVLGYEPIDEFLDGVMGGMVFGDLGEVFGGFESDHICGPP